MVRETRTMAFEGPWFTRPHPGASRIRTMWFVRHEPRLLGTQIAIIPHKTNYDYH